MMPKKCGFSIIQLSCVNSYTNGNTSLMSNDVTNSVELRSTDNVCYGMTPYHVGTIIPLGYVVATHGLLDHAF